MGVASNTNDSGRGINEIHFDLQFLDNRFEAFERAGVHIHEAVANRTGFKRFKP